VFLLPVAIQEEMNRGKPNWEHLNEDLHVLIAVEDAQNRATLRLKKAADEVRKLLVPLVVTCRIMLRRLTFAGVKRTTPAESPWVLHRAGPTLKIFEKIVN